MDDRERKLNVANEMIREVRVGVPDGHRHVRTVIILDDDTEIVLQEAAMANIVRAFITVKTHPSVNSVVLRGRHVEEKKAGFAGWQLLED